MLIVQHPKRTTPSNLGREGINGGIGLKIISGRLKALIVGRYLIWAYHSNWHVV